MVQKKRNTSTKSFYNAYAPEVFSIVNNAEITVSYLNNIISRIMAKKFNQTFFFDLSGVKSLTIDSVMYIIAILRDKLPNKENIEYIKDKYIEYKELTGNHIGDLEYLTKSKIDLVNMIMLIDNKLDEVKVNLYK